MYQIIEAMGSAFEAKGGHGFPSPFKETMTALSGLFSMDLVSVLHIECFGRADFGDKLFAATLVPIGLWVFDVCCQLGRMAYKGGVRKSA